MNQIKNIGLICRFFEKIYINFPSNPRLIKDPRKEISHSPTVQSLSYKRFLKIFKKIPENIKVNKSL